MLSHPVLSTAVQSIKIPSHLKSAPEPRTSFDIALALANYLVNSRIKDEPHQNPAIFVDYFRENLTTADL